MNQTWLLQDALELAWRSRFCPPDRVCLAAEPGPELAEHLKVCPACRRRREAGPEAPGWPEGLPAEAAPQAAPQAAPRDAGPSPGELWSLDEGLAAWGPKHRYYNPPALLVLGSNRLLPHHLLAAQTYYDPALRGPDDVDLPGGRFAQPWNVYTLHNGFLGRRLEAWGQEPAERVLAASRGRLQEVEPTSLLFLFRQMELELGCFYSVAAVCRLMEEHQALAGQPGAPQAAAGPALEGPGDVLANLPSRPELAGHLAKLGLTLQEGWEKAAAADLYFLASPAGERQRLAAAGEELERWQVPVSLFWLKDGKPVRHSRREAEVTDYIGFPKVMVGGRIDLDPPSGENWHAMFRWVDDQGGLLPSQACSLSRDSQGGFRFWAMFAAEGPPAPNVPLRLRLSLFALQ